MVILSASAANMSDPARCGLGRPVSSVVVKGDCREEWRPGDEREIEETDAVCRAAAVMTLNRGLGEAGYAGRERRRDQIRSVAKATPPRCQR